MTRILIAPDSLKRLATAVEVAQAIGRGWLAVRPQDEVSLTPMADGGEGTIDSFSLGIPGAALMPSPDRTIVRSTRIGSCCPIDALDNGLTRLASFALTTGENGSHVPGAGAAGGVGYGLMAWGASISAGYSAVGEALGIPTLIAALSRAGISTATW